MIEIKKDVTLLTRNNVKTIKGEKRGYITYILYLSPERANSRGINICPHASKGCAESCLVGSGFGGIYTGVMRGRVNKTEYYLSDRLGFLFHLKREIENAVKRHKGKEKLCIRLNGTSDILFERINVFEGGKNIFEVFPRVQFYDYTKNPLRFNKVLPKNYHLTFSRSETNENESLKLLERGFNVAMVFNQLPKEYKGYKVINGDESDLRFLDKRGVIVGLRYKQMTGKGADNSKGLKSGFVIDTLGIENRIDKTYKDIKNKFKKDLVLS